MNKFIFAILVSSAMFLSGCTTIVGSDSQIVPIRSNPENAAVVITDEQGDLIFEGKTPASIKLEKSDGSYWGKKRYVVKISKDGYKQNKSYINSTPSGWYIAGNLFSFGIIGWLVDPMSGSMFKLKPAKVSAVLVRK